MEDNKFAILHDAEGKEILVNLLKAETIQDYFISFNNYGMNVQESYEELKEKLFKMIKNI